MVFWIVKTDVVEINTVLAEYGADEKYTKILNLVM